MGEKDDGLLGVRSDLVGEKRLVVKDQGDVIAAGDVLRGDDGEFVPGDAGFECDAANDATSRGVANGRAVDHAGEVEIVDVLRLAGDFARALFAGDGFSD